MFIIDILDELENTSSRLEKEAILARNHDNDLLKRVFEMALNPYTNYWIKKIPEHEFQGETMTLEQALDNLVMLANREKTGNDAIAHLKHTLQNIGHEKAVVERVIQRDLRCGVQVATVNKTWKGLIPTFDVCLAHKDISGIRFPAFAQVKYDGSRTIFMYDGENVRGFSRNGKELLLHGVFDREASCVMNKGDIFDGEIVFQNPDGTFMDRKKSNGFYNKAVRQTITKEEVENARFMIWDNVVEGVPYNERFEYTLNQRWTLDDRMERMRLVPTIVVYNEQQAMKFYKEKVLEGEEGAILKNISFMWKGKRVKDVGKLKVEEEADLLVVDWEEGTGKNVGKLGALVVETSDGKLRVNVGTGFSDAQRASYTKDNCIGKIISVKYNQIIDDKKKETYSLFLPRFIEIREDKDIANTFEELK